LTSYLTSLDAPALRAAGIPEPWNYGTQDRVRFGEVDVYGHVNNATYLKWFETLRIGQLRDVVWPQISNPQRLVLRNVGVDFIAEVKPDESYILTASTVELRRTSFTQRYGVWVAGQLRTTGHAVVVTVDENGKVPMNDDLRKVLMGLDGATQL